MNLTDNWCAAVDLALIKKYHFLVFFCAGTLHKTLPSGGTYALLNHQNHVPCEHCLVPKHQWRICGALGIGPPLAWGGGIGSWPTFGLGGLGHGPPLAWGGHWVMAHLWLGGHWVIAHLWLWGDWVMAPFGFGGMDHGPPLAWGALGNLLRRYTKLMDDLLGKIVHLWIIESAH